MSSGHAPDRDHARARDPGLPYAPDSDPVRARDPGRTVRRFFILLLTLLVAGCTLLGPEDEAPAEPKPGDTTVLFLGSSYLAFNKVPDRFRDLSRAAGHRVFARYHLALGQPLSYFAQSADATAAIRELDWDYVVLQGGAQSAAYPQLAGSSDYTALRELHRKATEDSPGTRVVYMMPWAYEDGMTWREGRTETYEEMQLDIRAMTLAWAHELGLVLAPVGMAWYRVLTTWPHEEHFLHDTDWNHASREGSYLTAATIFSTIWVQDPTELKYSWKLQGSLARDLRAVAGATVLDSLDLWNITE